ncbi:hypothetical protein ILUMI_19017 [Ignelater luminosus]|uniref:Uncharacterized protein n=1 Tax=Ignelater luminosus TaxID=2038154 RepID=A0A8K0CLC1_IGNLU|nr:hypothetical protein ILUMI_19017 [Ignelater luminosus]
MSAVKNKKPITTVLPPITQNINSPSKRFQSRSVQTITSSVNSKLKLGRCRCPLIQKPLDYNQLQEMAKEIQEESLEAHLNDKEQKEEISKNDDVFANDKEVDQILVWTINPSRQKRCTCTSGKGVSFQQVLNNLKMCSEIKNCGTKNTKEPKKSLLPARNKASKIPLNSTASKHHTRNCVKSAINNNDNNKNKNVKTPNTNDNKEQRSSLQTVLKGLHDEFFALNSKYQELDTHIRNNKEQTSLETQKKLEEMEKTLNRKEEEINTVMSLYKDMLILRNQVKKLKEQKRTSVKISKSRSKSELQTLKQVQPCQDTV